MGKWELGTLTFIMQNRKPVCGDILAKFLVLLITILLSANSSGKGFDALLINCSNNYIDEQRLACFDSLIKDYLTGESQQGSSATSLESEPIVEPVESKGKWLVESIGTSFNGKKKHSFHLRAEQAVTSKNQTVTPRLIVECGNEQDSIVIQWDIYLGKNRTLVQIRFDEDEIVSSKWLISDSKRSIKYLGNSKSFIEEISNRQQLQSKIKPHNGSPIVARFKLNGFLKKLSELGVSCH